MKLRRRLAALILSVALLLGVPLADRNSTKAYADIQINFGTFHNSLSPYGNWVNINNYGPVWRPSHRQADWQPYYSNGYWAYTDYGWTWVSQDPWGHIAYHYGSWLNDPSYGWVWVPGYNWAPAWVTWQYTDDYIGWAPLPPNYYYDPYNSSYNRNDPYSRGGYSNNGYYDRPVVVERTYYVFVPSQSITSPNLNRVRIPVERNIEITRRARPITTINVENNHIVNHGPSVPGIERMKRNRISINQIQREARIEPAPIRVSRERNRLEVSSPETNRREARRVIGDFDREEKAARADRDRQLNDERRSRPERNSQPRLDQYDVDKDAEQRKAERRREREQERSAQPNDDQDRELRRQERRQQRDQINTEPERRRQSEEQQELQRRQEKEQRRAERDRQQREEEQSRTERRRQREQSEAQQQRRSDNDEQQQMQRSEEERQQRRLERQRRREQAEAGSQNQTNDQELQRQQQEREQRRQERKQRRMEQNQTEEPDQDNQVQPQQRRRVEGF
jgi:hypothetical protein